MNRICVFAVVCIALLAGCGKKASEEIDFGVVENSIYRNNYFGLSMKIPTGWSVQDEAAKQKIADLGKKVIAGDDKNLNAMLKASELQVVNLLAMYKHPIGTPVSFNPNIMCLAERVRHMPGIKRGKDYHYHSKKILQSGQIKVSFPKDIYTERIAGVDFDVMTLQMSVAGQTARQKMYTTIMKGYALSISVSFATDEEESELQKVLESVHFQ